MWQTIATDLETKPAPTSQAWRLRLIGLTIALLVVGTYFATVAWFGQSLAEDMRAGVRTLEPGSLILDTES